MTIQQIHDGSSDGALIGRSADKVGFYGLTTPIVQPTGATQAAVTEGGATLYGCTQIASLQSLGSANKTLLNKIRSDLVALNILKGSA